MNDDCISREQAIKSAECIIKSNSVMKAFCILRMLRELPSVSKDDDCISRQAVLDIMEKEGHKWGNDYRDWVDAIEEIKNLPPVNPQEPCEDEYIKVPKKALKYRTTGMVAYNAEWLKNHFDIERAVICGEQEPKWIPVSEKLPEIHNYSENYLVTLKRGGVHIAMFTECDEKHWWTYDDVIAWMPLFLKPYEPQESEEV